MKVNIGHEYLIGSKIHSGYKFEFYDKPYLSRIDAIRDILFSKHNANCILHVGAANHIFLIDKEIEQNIWLQKILTDNANTVVGIDINKEAVDHCNKIGYSNVYCLDAFSDSDKIISLIGGGENNTIGYY